MDVYWKCRADGGGLMEGVGNGGGESYGEKGSR